MTKEQYDFLIESGARPHLRGFEYLADFLDIFDKSENKDIRMASGYMVYIPMSEFMKQIFLVFFPCWK